MIFQTFTKDFSRITALEYIRDILCQKIGLTELVIGYDHHFGRNREGGRDKLNEYAELQIKDQKRTINFSEKLIDIFGSKKSSIKFARSFGLLLLDSFPPLKKYFSDKASGISARRPLQ